MLHATVRSPAPCCTLPSDHMHRSARYRQITRTVLHATARSHAPCCTLPSDHLHRSARYRQITCMLPSDHMHPAARYRQITCTLLHATAGSHAPCCTLPSDRIPVKNFRRGIADIFGVILLKRRRSVHFMGVTRPRNGRGHPFLDYICICI